MEKASDILKSLFDRTQQENGRLYTSLFKSWERIAGERLAAHTRIQDIRAGIAVIEVDHPGWLQMLQLSQARILDELRRQFPELAIRGLRMQLPLDSATSPAPKGSDGQDEVPGALPRPAESPERVPAAAPESASADQASPSLESIRDEKLRDLLERLGDEIRSRSGLKDRES